MLSKKTIGQIVLIATFIFTFLFIFLRVSVFGAIGSILIIVVGFLVSIWLMRSANNVGEAPEDLDESEIATVKRLIQKSRGASDFHARALNAGFEEESNDPLMGVTMEGHNCLFSFAVLPSRGADKIWSLVFKEPGEEAVSLVKEGKIVF